MTKKIVLTVLTIGLTIGGCARPAQVRRVAELSQPLAVQMQQSGDRLQSRMALQAERLEATASELAAQSAQQRASADMLERDLRLHPNGADSLAVLQEIRSRDAALLADPLLPVAATAPRVAPRAQTIDLAGLRRVVAGLGRLRGERRVGFADLLVFAQDVNEELLKIESEAAADTEPAPAAAGVSGN